MTLEEKINYLNNISKNCFVVANHGYGWEFSPYDGPFSCEEEIYIKNGGHILAPTFSELIDKCYEIACKFEEEIENEK
jgi:hypothetical protein